MVVTKPDTPTEYTLLDYLAIGRKRWPWVLLPIALLAGLAALYSTSQAEQYQSTAEVLLADTASQRTLDPSSQNPGFLSRELSNETSLAKSDKVESLVREELGFLPSVRIGADGETDVLTFTATAGDRLTAARHANTWAELYVGVKQEEAVRNITAATSSLQARLEGLREQRQRLRRPLDELDDRIGRSEDPGLADLLQRDYDRLAGDLRYELELVTAQAESTVASLTELELQAELSAVGEARIIQVAAPPVKTSNTPLSRNLALGALLGLLVGAGLALVAETRDNTIKSAADVQAISHVPVLASIPLASRKAKVGLSIATNRDPEGRFADGYHKVRSSLEFASFEKDIRSILVTSPNAAEGKSTTSSNLALALSSVGKRTVLVDVDFRRARVHDIYGVSQAPGLSDFILHGAELGRVAYSIDDPALDELLIVPTGNLPPSPAAFVGTEGFLKTLAWMELQADIVVMDAPPFLAVSDAHTLAKHVDAVILTALAGRTTKAEMTEALTVLGQIGARVIGVVLIGVEETDGYGKHSYYRSEADGMSRLASAIGGRLSRDPADAPLIDLDAPWEEVPKSATPQRLD